MLRVKGVRPSNSPFGVEISSSMCNEDQEEFARPPLKLLASSSGIHTALLAPSFANEYPRKVGLRNCFL